MSKKIVLLVTLVLLMVSMPTLVAQAAQEAIAADQVTVEMAVMQGPSGFGTIGLNRSDGWLDDRTAIDLAVFPSPNEVIARLAN